ncbi:MAG TPA: carboxypeptidase-like regulatory domain-containing protein [Candidatus Dormibacteraeota bacterium]|nr:carboxypeptidase-like regulatory domain-containing protein [Candidatus Dormibacteraeota bacterium]
MRTVQQRAAIAKFFLFGAMVSLFVFSSAYPSAAQTMTTGQVVGQVTDPSGGAVPAAKVDLRDLATGALRSTTTNSQGQYLFPQVTPGNYTVTITASGFVQTVAPSVVVEVEKTSTINLTLKLGSTSEVVEVQSTPGAELQMLDSAVGNTIGGDEILALPTLERNTTSLLLLQPLAMPQQFNSQVSRYGGQVAGARSDQNKFMVDGGEITNPISGNSDYYKNFRGGPEGAIPTPVESIQEFKVETNNPGGSISVGGGAQVVMVTKRGSDLFHGSLYEYYRGSALNANRWDANRVGQRRPNIVDNRFGGSVGGHILPDAWKTFFYAHYEGRRRSEAVFINRLVPSSSLRQGILQFKDATGAVIRYFLQPDNISAKCGLSGSDACDPWALGLNPAIRELWKNIPLGNDTTLGDGLNTIGFTSFGKFPVNDNFGVIRLDHSFTSRLHWTGSYRHFREDAGVNRQADIGGQLPGDVPGVPRIISTLPRQPRFLVTGLTANITPNVTNDFRVSWLRDMWQWSSQPPYAQLPAMSPAALVPGGDTVNALLPLNIDTQGARTRLWNSHGMSFRDDATWVHGNHLFQLGGSLNHTWVYFRRDDGQLNSQTPLQYFMTNGNGILFTPSYQPRPCTVTITADCLPSNQTASWNNFYAQVLGIVDTATILRARDANLQLLPPGTDLQNTMRYNQITLYAQDTWHLRPTFTFSYGLAWAASVPPVEDKGKLMMAVFPGSGILLPRSYLASRKQAALAGQVYNPPAGFSPIANTGRKYPLDFSTRDFQPRVSAAWNPNFTGGWRERIFGRGKTVFRGGYWHFYDRLNGVQVAVNTLQSVGFGQTVQCLAPVRNLEDPCTQQNSGSDPKTAFRIVADGSTIALPRVTTQVTPPVIPGNTLVPGANISFVPNSQLPDPQWTPGSHDSWDFTIQRELPGRGRLEIGYVGHIARNIYQGIDLNQVPFFMVSGGQTFAQAFDALAQQIKAGNVTAQPFLETVLAGSRKYCGAPFTSCTAGVVKSFGGQISGQRVRDVFNGIQTEFKLGPATNAATQFNNFFFWSGLGRSNYNAAFVSYHVRAYKGLTLDANFGYSHSLDTVPFNQDSDGAFSNSYDPHYDYGTSVFDRKYVFTLLGTWELPFRPQTTWARQVVGGWRLSPILSYATGLPLQVMNGSGQEFGQTGFGLGSEAVRIGAAPTSSIYRVAPTSGAGSSGGGKGTGLNLFGDPQAAFNAFRPIQVSVDTTSRGGTLRGLKPWNLDLSFAKKFKLPTEHGASISFSAEFFNMLNHVNFLDPEVNLQRPQTFGVINTQGNEPRQIQLGLRFDF